MDIEDIADRVEKRLAKGDVTDDHRLGAIVADLAKRGRVSELAVWAELRRRDREDRS